MMNLGLKSALFLNLLLAPWAHAGVAPHSLTVGEGFVDPLGFHDATPTLSWKLPEGTIRQTAYQIEVKDEAVLWDSGWVESDQSVFVPYDGEALSSRQQLEWRVRFRNEKDEDSEWSKIATVELGLLSGNDWSAQWIQPGKGEGAFTLIKAVYRSRDHHDLEKDVTALLQDKVQNNRLSVKVNNQTMGGDPAPSKSKELAVTYQVGGRETTSILREGKDGVCPQAEERVARLRREFPLTKKVARARLYVTARGLFEIQLNGEKVGRDHFANGWTSYDHRLDTLTYDVTDQLKPGPNSLGALLGTGWLFHRHGWKQMKEAPELLLQLEIFYEDGGMKTLVSDEQWEGSVDGPIISSSMYHGEREDARKEWTNWGPVSANADLGTAQLSPKSFAPVRETETLSVKTITEPEPGRFVFDLGQNMVGWARIRVPVEKDGTVRMRFAEMLQEDGTLYTENYRSARSTDYYTAAETGILEWEPRFTFHGFRYVELSGLPVGAKPEKHWVTGVVLHSDLARIGSFESSHEKLNQLQSNITWGQRGNFLEIPTDCPQRNERMGWTGDAMAFAPTSVFNYDCLAFWKRWLGTMRDDQMKDGRIPHVIPSSGGGGGSPAWMDAATIIPWEVYVRSGDLELLSDNYEMMERLVGWYRGQSKEGLIPKVGGFGDWCQPYSETRYGDTPLPLVGSVFYAHSVRILADSARRLGKQSDVEKYAMEADAVKKAVGEYYLDAEGLLQNAPETQTAYILLLEFDLVPAPLKAKAASHLLRLVGDADGHLRTGFLGTPFLTHVLDRAGYSDAASSVLFKETYPSWFYSINQGATTLWERWNSFSHADGFGDAGMNSFNHYAYGAIGNWMYERIAGLAPDPEHPGYKHFFIRPLIIPQLDWARAELETAYGKASSGWRKEKDGVVMDVVIPPNTTATIEFPNGRLPETVDAGTYRFKLQD